MNRLVISRTFFLLLVTGLLAACSTAQTPSPTSEVMPTPVELSEIDVCLSGSSTNAVMYLAEQAGVLEKYGLQANFTVVESGTTAANALITGDADICLMGSSSFVSAALAGEDLVMTSGLINQMFFALVVRPEIQSAQDLEGATLGSAGPGNVSYTFLRMALSSLGLDPDKDATLLTVGRTSDGLAAMEAGQIAGSVVRITDVGAAERLGFRSLLTADELGMPYQHNGVVASRAWVDDNRQVMASFTKALVDAIALLKQDKAQGIAALAAALELDPVSDAEYLDEVYSSFVEQYLERVPIPTVEGLQAVIDEARSENPTAEEITPEDIIDLSFVEPLQEDGYIDSLYQGE